MVRRRLLPVGRLRPLHLLIGRPDMTTAPRLLVGLAAGLGFLAVAAAPLAAAAPDCSSVGRTVTYCQTNGSTQIISTPPPWNYGGWTGIGFWPLVGAYGVGVGPW
ncbi:hypothetical protein KUF57_25650 [Mycolicibacterium sp. PAM1]|nr:hypothetical protein [Mycolicibacterium sp. PAM1]